MWEKFVYFCRLFVVAGTFAFFAIIYIAQLMTVGPLRAQASVQFYCWVILLSAGQSLRVVGELPPEEEGPYIYTLNHASLLDTIVVGAFLSGKFTAAVANNYMSWPLFGWIAKLHHCIAIDRSNPEAAKSSLMQNGLAAILNGFSVVGFPEGTRTWNGLLGAFKKGLFYLAVDAKKKVVPIYIEGAFKAGGRNHYRVENGEIVVHIGAPINPGSDVDDLTERARQAIIDLGAITE